MKIAPDGISVLLKFWTPKKNAKEKKERSIARSAEQVRGLPRLFARCTLQRRAFLCFGCIAMADRSGDIVHHTAISLLSPGRNNKTVALASGEHFTFSIVASRGSQGHRLHGAEGRACQGPSSSITAPLPSPAKRRGGRHQRVSRRLSPPMMQLLASTRSSTKDNTLSPALVIAAVASPLNNSLARNAAPCRHTRASCEAVDAVIPSLAATAPGGVTADCVSLVGQCIAPAMLTVRPVPYGAPWVPLPSGDFRNGQRIRFRVETSPAFRRKSADLKP